MNQYAYLIYTKLWNDIKYFQMNQLNIYNEIFDKLPNELNKPETYLHIDEFTYNSLSLSF